MSASLVTIGITAFNTAETIGTAVRSAAAQSWPNIEIVVVDDCSADATWEVLTELTKKYNTLRIYQNAQNSGVAYSRNRIIEEAKGAFIAFFDDDDESVPERVERQYRRIVEYEHQISDAAFVVCHAARIQRYPEGEERYEPTMGTTESAIAPYGIAVAERILTGKPVPGVFGSTATCSQMARTEVYRDMDGFDPAFRRSEDTDFNVRLALRDGHFIGIADPLVKQTMTLSSDKRLQEERAYTLQLLDKHRDFILQNHSYHFCQEWIDAKYDFLARRRVTFLLKLTGLFFYHPLETSKRLYWTFPNIGFNFKFSQFYHGQG